VSSDAAARRLLARLVDEQAIETEPIAEIRADLAALGADLARAVALARRLATGPVSPAVALLGKIAEAEEGDDEIAGLERSEVASVRGRVGEGMAAAAIANAQRAAGGESNVAELHRRRPRRLLYGLAGIAAALAASIVFYVGLSPTQFDREAHDDKTSALQSAAGTGRSATNETGAAQAPTTPPASEPYATAKDLHAQASPAEPAPATGATDSLQARMAPAANGPAQPAQEEAAQSLRQEGTPPAPQKPADAEARAKAELDKQTNVANQPTSLADAPPQPAGSATLSTTGQFTGTAGQSNAQQLIGGAQQNQIAAPFGLDRPVTALLIVDPKLVPSGLRQEAYPTGDLPGRLGDARRLAGDLPIAALVTLQLADRTADAVILAGATDELALRRDLDKDKTAPLASAAPGYDVVPLDRR
jgi:hypothetical protein